MVMFCSNCGNKLKNNAKVCPKCGTCPVCGTSVTNTFTDTRDGKVYKTVKIGNQVWIAENLAYDAKGSKCYNNDPANCQKYGRLYDWETAKKACPSGWHLPTKEEWQELINFVGGKKIAGKKLKAKSGWKSHMGKSGNGTNDYGFAALPGGYGNSKGKFDRICLKGYWWSATKYNASEVHSPFMAYDSDKVELLEYSENDLFSVRCLKD
jgi:uncharacterized protein (TIGR02145 family)